MPLINTGQLYRKFEQLSAKLGRNLWLDARSLAFMVENQVEAMSKPTRSQHWQREIPILDQGNLGSCTGNAGTGAIGTDPFLEPASIDPHDLNEDYAVQLYSDATHIDPYAGVYPPEDTGSSGLAICKVLRARGVIRGYVWARSVHGYARLLQNGPVLMGMPWYNQFFEPSSDGFIDDIPTWPNSGLAGGHEIETVGIELDSQDIYNSVLTVANSWGTFWGDGGYFRMRLRTYEQLSWVDLKQFVL